MIFKKVTALLLLLSIFALTSVSCKEKEIEPMAKKYYEYFDTESTVISYLGESENEFSKNCEQIRDLLGEYHRLFDIYYEYSGINNLKTVNKNAGKEPVKVDGKLIDFLVYSKEMYALTNGKTNIAMGSVLKLWHECRKDATKTPPIYRIPTSDELGEAKDHCDINNLIIDEMAGTVYISDPKMQLDVGAIGKGYATEKVAKMLIERGVTSYVLNIGGNIRCIGEKSEGAGWITGITHPNKASGEQFITKINIKNTSLVTSGDYERYHTVNGVNYHHIIDPVTLMPAAYFRSVSVLTEDSGLADALSTALFCMSYEDGLALVRSIGGVEVIWVDREYNVKSTDGINFAE